MRSAIIKWRSKSKQSVRIDNIERIDHWNTGFTAITMEDGNTIHIRADKIEEIFEGELPPAPPAPETTQVVVEEPPLIVAP